jgi:hypothetical protein
MEAFPQKLQNVLGLLEGLPDDLLFQIYTKHLRKYRLHNGKLIKLIDFEKYKFLEKVISRKLVSVSEVNIYDDNSGRVLPNDILEIKYTLANCCHLPDRKKQSIDDDMMYVYLNKDTGSYTIKQYRLKKNEEFFKKNKPVSMYFRGNYHRGNYRDYDWEVFTLLSDGSNQYV